MKATKGFSEGFTLIELVVVIAIIGVMAAVAIPGLLLELPKFRVNGAVRNLASDMQWAKMMAVKENNDFVMVFDSANNRYLIYDDNCSNGFSTSGSYNSNYDCTNLSETSDNLLVKTVNLSDISKGIIFGGVNTGCYGSITDNGATLNGSQATFQSTGIISGFSDNNRGTVYLIPLVDDDASISNPRLRAVTLIQTGSVKGWKLVSKTPCSWSQL